jgi:tripartite-type tricarboxylate transporter receptor subunit TctC
MIKRLTSMALRSVLLCLPMLVHAQFPERPIRIVVPFAAGGNIDLTARSISTGMSEALGQPVIVDNKPGAGGMVGAEAVARAAPDGYTLLLASTGSLASAPALYPKLGFDPTNDLAPSRSITRVPLILVVNPKLQVKTLADLIALAKSRPGTLTMASTGNGTSNHLAGELFQRMSGTKLIHVPYRGSSPALNDLLGGQVDLMFDNIPTSLSFVRSGKLLALGVTSASRSSALPQLPTLTESGLAGFEASTTTGLMMPAATPRDVAMRIHAALAKTLELPSVREGLVQMGADVSNLAPEAFSALMRDEGTKWSKVIRDANVRLD